MVISWLRLHPVKLLSSASVIFELKPPNRSTNRDKKTLHVYVFPYAFFIVALANKYTDIQSNTHNLADTSRCYAPCKYKKNLKKWDNLTGFLSHSMNEKETNLPRKIYAIFTSF